MHERTARGCQIAEWAGENALGHTDICRIRIASAKTRERCRRECSRRSDTRECTAHAFGRKLNANRSPASRILAKSGGLMPKLLVLTPQLACAKLCIVSRCPWASGQDVEASPLHRASPSGGSSGIRNNLVNYGAEHEPRGLANRGRPRTRVGLGSHHPSDGCACALPSRRLLRMSAPILAMAAQPPVLHIQCTSNCDPPGHGRACALPSWRSALPP